MGGRGTAVLFVEVEDQFLARMVFHLPVTADLLPSRAKMNQLYSGSYSTFK